MTTAVNVPGPAPTRTTVGGQRDAAAKGGANADDAEAGFGDVLTKMRGAPGDAKQADKVSPQAQGNGQQLRDEAAVLTSIDSVLESLVQADAQPADDDTRATPQAGAVTDIIAAIALPAMHAAVASNNGASKLANEAPALTTPAPNVSAPQPHDVQVTTDQATADVPPPVATATPDQATVVQNIAAATDAAPQTNGLDKSKQSRKPGEVDSGTALPRTPSASAADTDTTVRHAAKVLSQEAHFAPAIEGASQPTADDAAASGTQSADAKSVSAPPETQPSFDELAAAGNRPANQIADHILAETQADTQLADRTVSVPGQPAAKSVLKILHIQLQPADLGTVTVRMELKDAELSLHVEAERPETAELIRNDQDTLSKLLRASGYNVDPASVRVTDADRTAAAQQTGQNGTQTSFQSSPQSHPGASERQGNQQRGNANASGGESRPQTNRTEVHETPDRAGRGLYI